MKRGKRILRQSLKRGSRRGFTLVELLVVIAIIGIIIAILLVNIQAARSQARDETRLENIASIQLALGLYFDKYKSYPAVIYCVLGVNSPTCLTGTADDNFIACTPGNPGGVCAPTDPSGSSYVNGGQYYYAAISYDSVGATAVCGGYHLGAQLENPNTHLTYAAKFDSTAVTLCSGSSAGFGPSTESNPTLFYDQTSTSPTP